MQRHLHSREFEDGQREVLESIASGARLPSILEQIVLLIERQAEGMLCSILLFDRERGVVRHGAASRLPREFTDRIDGASVGPAEGSCGTAAYLGERVIVEDIATHPYWEKYRELALPLGLKACWSSPIFSPLHEVLGTFAMYYREIRLPTDREIAWVDRATHLASIAIMRDRTNEAILASERLRTIVFNGASDPLFSLAVLPNGRYRFLSINSAFLTATGLEENDIVGRTIDTVIPEPSLTKVLGKYEEAIRGRRTVKWDETTVYPAGKKHGEVSITPIFDDRGQCTNLVGAVRDVTDRKQQEERIAAQAALLDKAKDAIIVREIDRHGVRYWNKGAERIYGWSSEEAVGREITDLIYRESEAFRQAHNHLLERGEWSGEIVQHTKAGKQIVVDASWTLIRDENGQPASVFAINTDITEKKKLELQLFRAQRLESLGTLAGGIAHDFNNILAAITANTSFAIQDLSREHPTQELLSEIEKASGRATALVRRILAFSRDKEPRRQVVDLQTIVEEALKLLRATLPTTIRIQSSAGHDVPKIYADPTQVHQVVMNLGTNAAHAMEEHGGVLDVRVERWQVEGHPSAGPADLQPGTYARLVVDDSGGGMDEATLDRIFEPFFTTKGREKGTGLGLSVVHGVLKSHGGGISVRSAVGKGSTFSAFFPAATTADVDHRPVAGPLVRGTGERILFLDDEEAIVRVAVRQLKQLGYAPTGQTDAVRALESLSTNPGSYDGLVTDLSMPGLPGLDLIRAMLRARPGLPIVVTSGRIEPHVLRDLEQLGVREVMLKPMTMDELGSALHRLLSRRPRSSGRSAPM